MVVIARAALIASNLVALLIALRAVVNTRRLLHDRCAVVRQRAPQDGDLAADPLAVFTPDDVDALSLSRPRRTVRATRLLGLATPDPWAKEFAVQSHLLAVYANRLNDMAWIAGTVSELLLLASGAFAGVAAANYVADIEKAGTGSTVFLAITLLIAAVAIMLRVSLTGEWRAAAGRYRELAQKAVPTLQTAGTERLAEDAHSSEQ